MAEPRAVIRRFAILVAALICAPSAHASGVGVTSMYYADLAAWAAFRERNPPPPLTGKQPADPMAGNFLYQRFAAAAKRFDASWGALPQTRIEPGEALREGATGPRVAALRARLGLAAGTAFDGELAKRVAEYRRAHDLAPGTQADGELIASLNLGHAHYARLIAVNLKRTTQFPAVPGKRFLLVDSAEQRLHIYENGKAIDAMKVIVGKPEDQTPMLAGFLTHAVLNPYWNVPPDLVRDRYAARVIKGGKAYLDTRGFEVTTGFDENARVLSHGEVDWAAVQAGRVKVWMRQKPGAANGMGRVKFMFPNPYGVYLHDTPSIALFNQPNRFESAGCVRVERPWDLAKWLYGQPITWQGRPIEQRVNVPDPVPVYITYFTAVPTESGFDFRSDIYSKDRLPI